jgi:hypothetical protein
VYFHVPASVSVLADAPPRIDETAERRPPAADEVLSVVAVVSVVVVVFVDFVDFVDFVEVFFVDFLVDFLEVFFFTGIEVDADSEEVANDEAGAAMRSATAAAKDNNAFFI